jgi:hypothetical protein
MIGIPRNRNTSWPHKNFQESGNIFNCGILRCQVAVLISLQSGFYHLTHCRHYVSALCSILGVAASSSLKMSATTCEYSYAPLRSPSETLRKLEEEYGKESNDDEA